MPNPKKRHVRNRTSGEVFVKGHGVVPGDFVGDVPEGAAAAALVDASVFADAKRPEEKTTTTEKEGGS